MIDRETKEDVRYLFFRQMRDLTLKTNRVESCDMQFGNRWLAWS